MELENHNDSYISLDHNYSYEQLLLDKYPEDIAVRTLNADFLKRYNRLEECRGELEFLISKEKNNYLVWEELLMLYNQLEDTAALYRGGVE